MFRMKYLILEAGSAKDLEKLVIEHIEDGYDFQGGVSIGMIKREGDSCSMPVYGQAVFKVDTGSA